MKDKLKQSARIQAGRHTGKGCKKMRELWRLSVLACSLFFIHTADGGVLRGATFSSNVAFENDTLITYDVTWRTAWRRSSLDVLCTNETIANGTVFTTGETISNLALNITCTDFSEEHDWMVGEGNGTFSDRSNYYFYVSIDGCCWDETINYPKSEDSYYRVRGSVRRGNNSPNTTAPLLVRLQHGCEHVIEIPVSDPDGDEVRCLWADSGESRGLWGRFPGAVLDSESVQRAKYSSFTHFSAKRSNWYKRCGRTDSCSYSRQLQLSANDSVISSAIAESKL